MPSASPEFAKALDDLVVLAGYDARLVSEAIRDASNGSKEADLEKVVKNILAARKADAIRRTA